MKIRSTIGVISISKSSKKIIPIDITDKLSTHTLCDRKCSLMRLTAGLAVAVEAWLIRYIADITSVLPNKNKKNTWK